MQAAWVRSLFSEQRSYMPCGQKKLRSETVTQLGLIACCTAKPICGHQVVVKESTEILICKPPRLFFFFGGGRRWGGGVGSWGDAPHGMWSPNSWTSALNLCHLQWKFRSLDHWTSGEAPQWLLGKGFKRQMFGVRVAKTWIFLLFIAEREGGVSGTFINLCSNLYLRSTCLLSACSHHPQPGQGS